MRQIILFIALIATLVYSCNNTNNNTKKGQAIRSDTSRLRGVDTSGSHPLLTKPQQADDIEKLDTIENLKERLLNGGMDTFILTTKHHITSLMTMSPNCWIIKTQPQYFIICFPAKHIE